MAAGFSDDIAYRLTNRMGLVCSELALQRITAAGGYVYFKTGLYRDKMQQLMTIYVDEYRKDELGR